MLKLCVSAFLLLLAVSTGFAQTAANVSGTVKDPSGAIISSVVVTLLNEQARTQKQTVANEAGAYSFVEVAPGSYKIQTTAPGFADFEQVVTVAAGQQITLDLPLQLAESAGLVSVEAAIDPFNVVPDQASNSLFGLDKPLEEIPRSIAIADSEMLTRYNVKTVNDVVTVSSGAFTGSYFGVPGSVFLRGDIGDNFFRGFRRVENRGNYQTPVAATDHIEIVKGPPSPILGGGRVGGFMNFIPKTARSESAKWLEQITGKATAVYGSYDQKIASFELGMPFTIGGNRAGLYGFMESEDSHSYYKGVASRYKLGQIAFDMELSSKVRLQFGMQGYKNLGTQNIGWNRVTQELVDDQMYISGQPLVNVSRNGYNIGAGDVPANIFSTFAFRQDMSGPFLFGNPNAARLYALDPATIKLVKLPLDRIMIDEGDFTKSTTFTSYFDVVYDIKPGLNFKNQTFYDGMDHKKYSSYGFGAGYNPWTIENKSSLTFAWNPGSAFRMNATTGFNYRRVEVSAGEERNWYQTVDRRDLSVGATPNDRFQGPFNSNGQIFFQYYQTGKYTDTGAYWLSDVHLWDRLGATVGVRFDRFSPDFMGRFDGEPLSAGKATKNTATYNASLSYRLPFLQPYATVATSRFLDLGQGNELEVGQVRNGTFIQTSNLYEVGVKTAGLGEKLFASLAAFRQKRATFNNLTASPDYFLTKGIEVDARAFLMKRLSLTGTLTWQNPVQLNVPFLLGIPPTLLGLTPQQGYGGRFIGLASIFGMKAPFPVGGQPHWVTSPFATVSVTRNAGFTVGTTWVSAVKTGYVSDVTLPSYSVWRGGIFYQKGPYRVNVSMNNIFNKVYFQSQYLFWDVFIKPGSMRTATLTATYSF